jgi:DNA-binding NarL/FixJ family response regulator
LWAVRPPSVVIAANPYEAEMCRKALAPTGLDVQLADDTEHAIKLLSHARPLVIVVAAGWVHGEPRELIAQVRAIEQKVPLFLVSDRDGEFPDEDQAVRAGATRLFLRPVEVEALADAIEKVAVENELHNEVSDQLDEVYDAADVGAEVELEADFGDEWREQKVARQPTEVLPPSDDAAPRAPAPILGMGTPGSSTPLPFPGGSSAPFATPAAHATPPPVVTPEPAPFVSSSTPAPFIASATPAPFVPSAGPTAPPDAVTPPFGAELGAPPPTAALPIGGEPTSAGLLRADDVLAEAAGLRIQALAASGDFVVKSSPPSSPSPSSPSPSGDEVPPLPAPRAGDDRWRKLEDRGTFARRLQNELSEAERRLFPDAQPAPARYDYDDALGDIDLDSLGVDTIPGIAADALDPDARRERVPEAITRTDGESAATPPHAAAVAATPTPPPERAAAAEPASLSVEEEGALDELDIAELLSGLHASGWTGRVTLRRGDAEKAIYFDGGQPVFATSNLLHDRLGDLLYREGKLTREQHQKTRELTAPPGRATAAQFVELGLLKQRELYPALRRHCEDLIYSCFAWDAGRYRLTAEQAPPEDKLRLSSHLWALVAEGVRRKYGLERLAERVGPSETILIPTTALDRALNDCELTQAERVVAELFDGERSLGEVGLATHGLRGATLSEPALYALAWTLIAIGAVRPGDDSESRMGVRAASTLVTPDGGVARERRAARRDDPAERPADLAIDRERLLAKRAQVQDGDYFAILGVERHASTHEIERAFERQRADFAPERFGGDLRVELRAALDEIHEVLDEARRVLADDRVRAVYREHLVQAE